MKWVAIPATCLCLNTSYILQLNVRQKVELRTKYIIQNIYICRTTTTKKSKGLKLRELSIHD